MESVTQTRVARCEVESVTWTTALRVASCEVESVTQTRVAS